MAERLVSQHLCGVDEIAKTFRVSPATVREWREEGMPCLAIGNKCQARYDEIWEWLKRRHGLKPVK